LALLSVPRLAVPAAAQTGRNVLLVVNSVSPESKEIAEHYAKARSVPENQVLSVSVPAKDDIERAEYSRAIENPIGAWLNRHTAQDRILYIVLTKGVPLRIAGTGGRSGTVASVDSELALLYRRMVGATVAPQGPVPNPYFLGDAPLAQARPFSHVEQDIFLVTRLDGYTVADVKTMIDKASAPRADGRIVLDMKAAFEEKGNEWLKAAADRLDKAGAGERVQLEQTSVVVRDVQDVMGYYSWGSNDPAIRTRTFGFTFVPGAIAGMFVSTSGRTFTAPPAEWKVGSWDNRQGFYARSPESLAGDLIRDGITGISASVAEPYLDGSVRPDILFPAYLAGFNLAEAFYLAAPYVGWQTVIVGDPLCRPVGESKLSAAQLEPPIDPESEQPVEFTRRWVQTSIEAAADAGALRIDALKLALKAMARTAKDDQAGARSALEEATKLEPRMNGSHFILASMYEQAGEYDKAAERYRVILGNKSDDVAALNNLAFYLATRAGKPGDAVPMARRAYTLSHGNPTVADTYAWALYLTGDLPQAARYVGAAVRGAPNSVEIRYHAAAIFLAGGQVDVAKRELAKALELDPALGDRADVKDLRQKLGL
jgi:uncharacterized protein (TIGR03790 family)